LSGSWEAAKERDGTAFDQVGWDRFGWSFAALRMTVGGKLTKRTLMSGKLFIGSFKRP
jgi:hypothetical protein